MTKSFSNKKISVKVSVPVLAGMLFCQGAYAQMAYDPDYQGSSYNEIVSVIDGSGPAPTNPKELYEYNVYGPHGVSTGQSLPHYRVDFLSMGGLFSSPLAERAKKTVTERADTYNYFKKIVHANGICVTGEWKINDNSPYSGLLESGTDALFIGRLSVSLNETTYTNDKGEVNARAFGFVGKIFPTMDPNKKVPTTSLFTTDVLSGTDAPTLLGVKVTNDPPIFPNLNIAGSLSKIAPAFKKADSSPTFRPVTQLARVDRNGRGVAQEEVKAPIWLRLSAAEGTPMNTQNDFRNEISQAMDESHQNLQFDIEASSTTSDRTAETGWQKIGQISLHQAIVSFGCDRQIHFSHPKDDNSKPKK